MAEERFAAARVAALVGVAKTAYITTIAAGGLLLAILWDAFPATVLLAWFGALLAGTVARPAYPLPARPRSTAFACRRSWARRRSSRCNPGEPTSCWRCWRWCLASR